MVKILKADEAIAILIMVYISGCHGMAKKGEIAKQNGIRARRLEPILTKLVKNGLLISHRGPIGGYSLSRERRRINLKEVVEAIGLPHTKGVKTNSENASKVLKPIMANLTREALASLAKINLEQLRSKQNSDSTATNVDFSI